MHTLARLPTTDQLRSLIERPEFQWLWTPKDGKMRTPALVDKVFGDGRKLMWLTTINNRPNYWVVRVDSSWQSSNDADPANGDLFIDHVYEIVEEIEDQFGILARDNYGETIESKWEPHPVIDTDTATWWGVMHWSEIFRRSDYAAAKKRRKNGGV